MTREIIDGSMVRKMRIYSADDGEDELTGR
jgi:hypothetical protein